MPEVVVAEEPKYEKHDWKPQATKKPRKVNKDASARAVALAGAILWVGVHLSQWVATVDD